MFSKKKQLRSLLVKLINDTIFVERPGFSLRKAQPHGVGRRPRIFVEKFVPDC